MTELFNRNREIQTQIRNMIAPHNGLTSDSTPEDIHSSFVAIGVNDRASYLNWVHQYSQLINEASDMQRALRVLAKQEDDTAQCYRAMNKAAISRAIAVRHLSRMASRVSRKTKTQEVAA
jgi:hypothetical protein